MNIEKILHYGIKGMRWGVRKDDPKTLSNKELKARIERMNLEKQYNRLTTERSAIKRGASTVSKILGNAAQQAATQYVAKQFSQALADHLGG